MKNKSDLQKEIAKLGSFNDQINNLAEWIGDNVEVEHIDRILNVLMGIYEGIDIYKEKLSNIVSEVLGKDEDAET